MVKKYNKYIYILIFIFIFIFIFTIKQFSLPIYSSSANKQQVTGRITKEYSIKEDIVFNSDEYIDNICLKIGTYKNKKGSENIINFYVDNKLKETIKFNTIDLINDEYNTFKLSKPLFVGKNKVFTIEWKGEGAGNNSVSAYYNQAPSSSRLYINQAGIINEINGSLALIINGKSTLIDYISNMQHNNIFIKFIDYVDLIYDVKIPSDTITKNIYYKQFIDTSKEYYLKSIELYTATWNRENSNMNIISIVKNDETIYEREISSKDITDNSILLLDNINQKIKQGDYVYIKLASVDGEDTNSISYYGYKNGNITNYKCSLDNQCIKTDFNIVYSINNSVDYNTYITALLNKEKIEYEKEKYYVENKDYNNKILIILILFIVYILIVILLILINSTNIIRDKN